MPPKTGTLKVIMLKRKSLGWALIPSDCVLIRKFGHKDTWGKTIWGHRENRIICMPERPQKKLTLLT